MDAVLPTELRAQLVDICCATAFLVAGLTTCTIAVMRRSGVRVFVWLGIWCSAYGVLHLLGASLIVDSLPHPLKVVAPYIENFISYTIVVFASLAWLDLVVGKMRRFVGAMIAAALVVAALGVGDFLLTGRTDRFMPANNLVAAGVLLLLITLVSSRTLYERYLLLPNPRLLALGTFVFAAEALSVNLARPLGFRTPLLLDHLGFAALLLSFGFSALQMVITNEHRLLTIESELEVARQIQEAILPTGVPQLRGLHITATYQPMTAVAGDFYEFLPVDDLHAGLFIADVCGHGVPAALIASMLKVAVQSVAPHAANPSRFLRELNRALYSPLKGKLVSAAYLWIDMEIRQAQYSAAGHPPLLLSRRGHTEKVESNGLLFGVLPTADYPVCTIDICDGDRLMLYTDGMTEPENGRGEAFGDLKLAAVLDSRSSSADTSCELFAQLRKWNPSQQDDATLILLDVV